MRPVYISWVDHSSFDDQSWRTLEELKTLEGGVVVHTLGWLVREDEEFYYVVFSMSTEMFNGCMAIVKSAVKAYLELPVDELPE